MPTVELQPIAYGSGRATSVSGGFSTAILLTDTYPKSAYQPPTVVANYPSWGPVPSSPDDWNYISIGIGNFFNNDDVQVRGVSNFVVTTSSYHESNIPAGTQVGDVIFHVLTGRKNGNSFPGGTDQWTTDGTWTWITGTSNLTNGGSIPFDAVLTNIYREVYTGTPCNISTSEFDVWSIQSFSVFSSHPATHVWYNSGTTPSQTLSEFQGSLTNLTFEVIQATYDVGLTPAVSSFQPIYLPGHIEGSVDTSQGIFIDGIIDDPNSISVNHRVVAEFGNNSLNDNQVVTASSVKTAPRGFHAFETTTDSYQNPPSGSATTPSTLVPPELIWWEFYPGDASGPTTIPLPDESIGFETNDILIVAAVKRFDSDYYITTSSLGWTEIGSSFGSAHFFYSVLGDGIDPIYLDIVGTPPLPNIAVVQMLIRGADLDDLFYPSVPVGPTQYTYNIRPLTSPISLTTFSNNVEAFSVRRGGLHLELCFGLDVDDGDSGIPTLSMYKAATSAVLVDTSTGTSGSMPYTMALKKIDRFDMPDVPLDFESPYIVGHDPPLGIMWTLSGSSPEVATYGGISWYIPPQPIAGVNGDFRFQEYFPTGWEENWTYTETNGSDIINADDGGDYFGEISLGPTATQQAATETNVLLPRNFDAVIPIWLGGPDEGYVQALPETGDEQVVVSFRSKQEHSSQTLANCYAVYLHLRLKKLSIYKVNGSGAHVLLGTGTSTLMNNVSASGQMVLGIQAIGSTIRAKVGLISEGNEFNDAWDVQVTDSTYAGDVDGNYLKLAYMDGIPSSTGGGGSGGGTGGGGGSPPGGNGTANLRQMFLDRYAHPATIISATTDEEVATAITSLSSSGGIIELATGTYGPISFVDVNPSQYILLMPASGATVHIDAAGQADAEGLERGILIKNSSYIGAYGFEISSVNASGHPYADCVGVGYSHHIAIWNCNIHDGASGVGGVECNHYDICYNYVHDTSGWLETFASGISLYKLVNIGGGVDADGYDNRIIGNISYNNENDPSFGGAITDGNGIIVDIANGDYATNLVGYTGRVLILNNISTENGGRGIHSLFSRNCDIMFNTSIANCNSTAINGQAEIDTIGSENCIVRGNISLPNDGNKWFELYEVSTSPVDNVVLGEPDSYSTANNFDHSAQGSNYFGTPTVGNWSSYRPITSDEVVIDSALYSRIGGWPDALRNYRTDTTWSAGAIEVFANSSTSPDTPTAPFFYPEDYGAVGDGVTDDSVALQACMDAVLANGSGSMILNSAKTYCHSAVLFCDEIPMYGGGSRVGNDIVGGATLLGTNDTTSNVWLRDGASAYGIIFRNDATTRGANYEHNKVTIRGGNITVNNCAVHGSYAAGFMASAAFDSNVSNVCVYNTNSDSIHNTDACDNIVYTDCYVQNSGDDCFATIGYGGQGPNTNITWIRPVCRGGNARGGAVSGGDNIVFQDIDFQDTAYAGLYLANETVSYDTEPTTNVTVTGGKITGCANGNNGHPSILFFQDVGGTVNNCSVTGVDIYNQAGDGAYFIEGRGGPTSCSATNVTVFSTPRTALTAGGISATNVVYG